MGDRDVREPPPEPGPRSDEAVPSPTARPERRLAAIMAADVVGYSRLIEEDETGTLARLKAHRTEFIEPLVAEHHGRIVKLMGDGALCEFGSVVDAVACAVAIQRGMPERELAVPEEQRIRFRIGINLGDVIYEADGDIYGDGVNIAARLEQLCAPGGVTLSGTAYDHLQGKLGRAFQYLGERNVKNISRPVRVYRIDLKAEPGFGAARGRAWRGGFRPWAWSAAAGAVLLLMAAAGGLFWYQAAGPPLSEHPSVAVLPFTNMSNDPAQEYLSDGITEDLTTALSRFPELLVIARNSTFRYKGQAVDMRRVGKELGARYLVEGGLQVATGRVRVTAQLVDSRSSLHRWADRYDRELTDIFVVQDEITQRIVGALVAQVSRAELERAMQEPPARWEAYDYLLQAYATDRRQLAGGGGEALLEVRRLLERSLAVDPGYARAWAALADSQLKAWLEPYNHPTLRQEYQQRPALDRALMLARKAVELDDGSPEAHAALGAVLNWERRHDDAVAEFRRAIELNPNLAAPRYGDVLVYAGHAAEAVDFLSKRAMRLDPFFPPNVLGYLGHAYYTARQYVPAIEQLTACSRRAPRFRPCRVWAPAAYAQAGRPEEARGEAAQVLQLQPEFTIGKWMGFVSYKQLGDATHLAEGLRQAGLPD
jgi:adenylate cyclase